MTKPRKAISKTKTQPPLILRMVSVRPESANDEKQSLEVVIASEYPVERYDEQRADVYREILAMDGVSLRGKKKQLPIVDSHDRSTVRNVLGSVRNLRIEGTELVGDAMFAHDQDSQNAYQKIRDGHLTDFSITATPLEHQWIDRGTTVAYRNQSIEGPAMLVTRWQPTDASLVPAGADETSTVRELFRSYEIQGRKKPMTDEMRSALVDRGMPTEIENAEDALRWMLDREAEDKDEPEEIEPKEGADMEDKKEAVEMAVDRALKADAARRREITALCDKAKLERSFTDELCGDRSVTLDVARQKILDRIISKPIGSPPIDFVSSGDDRTTDAMRDGLVARAMGRVRTAQIERNQASYNPFGESGPAPGYKDFQNMSLLRLAEEVLRRGGVNTDRMTGRQIALAAMGHAPTMRGLHIQREAYHTTGVFSDILLDASNKSLLAGYEEAPFTWSMWARQAPSVADFKTINRVRFSESPDLEEVPENAEYSESVFSDSREFYKISKFGRIFSTTWETIINDDVDAISRVPMMHGNAARRIQNKKIYQILTDNANMSDGVALFHSTHGNHSGAAAAPSVTTLNTAYKNMMIQTGLGGSIINVVPRYVIVPPSYSATLITLLTSMGDPAVGGSAAGNSNVLNLYGPSGARPLIPVVEPTLEANSATIWYVAADYNQIDTVELTFLQGEESPVIESEWDFKKDGWMSKIRQTFGTKAVDWRGLYTNQA